MAGIIPKEQLAAYERWQFDSFDSPRPRTSSPPPEATRPTPAMEMDIGEAVPAIPLPTAEDIERIHNEAQQAGYQAGYEEGYQAGLAQGDNASRDQVARLASLVENVESALQHLDQNVADQLLALALEVAGQVLRGTVRQHPDTLLPVIREALAALPIHHGHVNLHLHPTDAQALKESMGDSLAHAIHRIVEDQEVAPGGCIVRTGSSEVDATLPMRWKRVLESIGAPVTPAPDTDPESPL